MSAGDTGSVFYHIILKNKAIPQYCELRFFDNYPVFVQGVFLTGTPLKKVKPRLGESTLT